MVKLMVKLFLLEFLDFTSFFSMVKVLCNRAKMCILAPPNPRFYPKNGKLMRQNGKLMLGTTAQCRVYNPARL